MTKTVEPPVQIPRLFKDYVAFPRKLFAMWAIMYLPFFLYFAGKSSPFLSDLTQGSNYSQSVSVGSPFSLSMAINGDSITVESGTISGATVRKIDPERVELKLSDGTLFSTLVSSIDEEGGRVKEILNSSGARVYKIKVSEDEIKIQDASGEPFSKIKFKEDKFNIYGADGKRTYYGKEKKGSILIRDDSGKDITWVTSAMSLPLDQAAPLSLPLEDSHKVLLFADAYLP